ncbi:hypothetical protein REPUB_Repub20aG0011800 [Reevesia pubescens]
MHDLVHDLAQSISKADIGVKLWHSLFLKTDDFHIVEKSKGLRVLNFCGAEMKTLPDSIGRLKHLRYLDISGTAISRLPKSITQLYHLQTLRLLRCNSLEKLPNGMKNLVSLRHLYIDDARHVPGEIGCLTSLQTLPIFYVDPERRCGIGELGCLSELRGKLEIFNLHNVRNKEESRGAKLWEKKKLDKLGYTWSSEREDCSNDEEILEALEPHSNLKSLTIENFKGGNYPSWLVKTSDVSGPSASLHSLTNLVELKLSGCENLKNLPTALGQYPKLKFLEIEGLKNVRCIGKEFYVDGDGNRCDSGDDENKAIPLLFPVLEKFTLRKMEELEEWLVEVEPTIPVFPSLKELEIKYCEKLSRVPMMKNIFSSLERLCIEFCELSWTEEENGVFPSSLKVLRILKCPNLRCIPSIEGGDISSLQELSVIRCEKLSKIGEGLLAFSPCLREVVIWKCPNLKSIPLKGGSQSLMNLDIRWCIELREIEGGLSKSKRLERLEIEDCPNLTSIPSLDGFSSLLSLKLEGCEKLTSLPSGLPTCTSLQKLSICNFTNLNLESIRLDCLTRLKTLELGPFSEDLEEFPVLNHGSSLESLELSGWEKLSSLPHQLQHFTSLKELSIRNCTSTNLNLESIRLDCLTRLKTLKLGPFSEELEEFPVLNLGSPLEGLTLYGWKKLSSLPHQLQHFTSLQSLDILDFDGVKALPDWLGNLSSLQSLFISNCKNLEHLPSKEAMQHLPAIWIINCPLLKDNNNELSKISHIPFQIFI